jgi:hypothetical protein
MRYRVTIKSTDLPNARYRSGWIVNTGIDSSVSTCPPVQGCGGDGSALANAWEDRQKVGTSTWQCRNIVVLTAWRDCTND